MRILSILILLSSTLAYSAVTIDPYAWQFPQISNITGADDLKTELQEQIQAVLTNGHLAPIYISRADQQSVGYAIYLEPGRIITTLAWAYPHLTTAQQTSLRTYVAGELADSRFAPWGSYPLPKDVGTPRELHPRTKWWYESATFGQYRPSVQTIYGLWLYGYRTGDWTPVQNNWANIKTAYNSRSAQGNLYGTMNAHVAMARLADRFADTPMRTTALNNLQTQLDTGLNFSEIESNACCRPQTWNAPYADMYDTRMNGSTHRGWMFLNLSPEIGRYLRDLVSTATLNRNNSGKATFPLWWVLQANYFNRSWTGDEGSGLLPEIVGMIAPVERWVVQASATTLRGQVKSSPTGIGDSYWLEALVQAIEAHGTLAWVDVRSSPPPPDTTAPGAVTNLTVSSVTTSSATLLWTSPGDDGYSGTATSYDARYSTANITAANFPSANQASGEPTPAAAGNSQSFTINGLSANTTYYFAIKATDEAGNVAPLSNVPNRTTSPAAGLPSPWQDRDVGSVGLVGSASYSSGTFTVNGSGADIWDTADAFHFVHQTLSGNGEIKARVATVGNTDPWAKAGVMFRESFAANSKHAFMLLSSGSGLAFQRRTSTGGTSTNTAGGAATAPRWVRLVRSGNTFTAYSSTNGTTWTTVGSDTISMSNSVVVGLAVTAHNNTVLNTSTFDNVTVTTSGGSAVGVNFSGATNSYAVINDAAALDIAGSAMTMEAWVKVTALPATGKLGVVIARELGSSSGYALLIGDNGRLQARLGTSGNNWFQLDSAAQTWTSGTWYHVAASYDGANVRIFRDGTQIASAASTGTLLTGANKLYFGGYRYDWNPTDFLNAAIDEIRLSRIARYTANFTAPTAAFSSDANTVGLWHLNENSGTTAADSSGNALNATLNGSTWTTGKF